MDIYVPRAHENVIKHNLDAQSWVVKKLPFEKIYLVIQSSQRESERTCQTEFKYFSNFNARYRLKLGISFSQNE